MTVYDWLFDSRIFGIVKLSRGDRICCQPMRNCVVYTIRYTIDAELVFSLLLARESHQKHSIWRCIEMPCHSCDISVMNGLITGYFCSVCKDMLLSLQWSHNGRDSVSNHQPHECLLNRLFRRKENIKAPRHWPLCGEFTGDWWIPHTNGQLRGKCFHLMTSSWSNTISDRASLYNCRYYTVKYNAISVTSNSN